jgi:NADH-quinone oxidoreductase subunit N
VTPSTIFGEIGLIGPANALLLAGIVLLVAGFYPKTFVRETLSMLAMVGILIAGSWILVAGEQNIDGSTLFAIDRISITSSWLTVLAGAMVVLIGWDRVPHGRESEYYSCLLFLLSGILYASAAKDLTSLFLGLELVSIPTIVLLAISGTTDYNRESTLKYFTLSAFSSAFFLLGCSYLYGACGSTNLEVISASTDNPSMMKVGLALAMSGLFFRLTAVPFHFYSPDLFAGSSLSLVSGLAFLPKLTGIVAILRLLGGTAVTNQAAMSLLPLVIIAATLTMTVGNFAALRQTCMRRMLAYSGVAHSGYLLAGVGCIIVLGRSTAILTDYLAAYAVMSFAVFAILLVIERNSDQANSSVIAFDGLFKRNPWLAGMGTIALFSQIGLPPTAGFWAKFQVFASAIGANRLDLRVLAIIMAINAAVGAVVYLGIVSRMFRTDDATVAKGDAQRNPQGGSFAPNLACLICTALTIVWFLAP